MIASLKAWLIGALVGLGALMAIIFGARRSGKQSERAKHERERRRRSEAANEIKDRQLDAAANRPRNRRELRDRMRDPSS